MGMHRGSRWQQTWSEGLSKGWHWMRTAPHLEAWGVLLMVAIVFVCQSLGFHESLMPWLPSSGDEVPRDWQQPDQWTLFYYYLAPYLKLIAMLGGLLFHLAVVRAQPSMARLIRPTWMACSFLALWLVLGDAFDQWQLMHGVTMGKPFSMGAYLGKLVLLVIAALTPAVALMWYQRSPIWERYLLRSIAQPLAFCLFAFCSLWVLADLLDSLRDFQDSHVPLGRIIGFYVNLVPFVLVESAAPALLLATLHAILRLVKSNEIVSLHCAGLSTARVLRPFWVMAAMVSLVSMAMNYDWAQRAEGEREAMLLGFQTDHKNPALASAMMHYQASTRRLWFVAHVPFDLRYEKLRGVEVRQFDEHGELQEGWSAATAYRWSNGLWTFSRGIHSRYQDGLSVPVDLFNSPLKGHQGFEAVGWPETLWDIVSGTQSPEVMGVPDLTAALHTPGRMEDESTRLHYVSQLWHRLSFPWQGLALAFLVSLLPPLHSRHGLMRCVGIGIACYLGLTFINSSTLNLARSGRVPAGIALWLPHALLFAAGFVLLRHRSGQPWSWPTLSSIPWRRWSRWLRGRRTRKMTWLGDFYELNAGREEPRIRG